MRKAREPPPKRRCVVADGEMGGDVNNDGGVMNAAIPIDKVWRDLYNGRNAGMI